MTTPPTDSMHPETAESTAIETSTAAGWMRKLVILAAVGALFAVLYTQFGSYLSLSSLAEHEAAFRAYQQQHPVLIYGIAFTAYVIVAGLSLPGATGMTLLTGWLFGFWRAVLLVSFASTTGASLAFLLSRYLLRDSIQQKFGDRLKMFNDALEREGAFYLFTLRLIPAVPFFVINVVMGLTPIRLRTYWWVSQIGMLAGTGVYVYAGASVPSLQTLADGGVRGILSPRLLAAFVILGLFPIVLKKLLGRFRPATSPAEDAAETIPLPETIQGGIPHAASDDGNRLSGARPAADRQA